MNPKTRATVLRLLDAGWPVARVADATTWPRRQIEAAASQAGMIRRPGSDTWVAGKAAPRPPAHLDRLLEVGDASARARTRALSARVRHLVHTLEAEVTREDAEVAAVGYDVARVRAWARAAGLNPPDRGRYLPAHLVAAWREAGSP